MIGLSDINAPSIKNYAYNYTNYFVYLYSINKTYSTSPFPSYTHPSLTYLHIHAVGSKLPLKLPYELQPPAYTHVHRSKRNPTPFDLEISHTPATNRNIGLQLKIPLSRYNSITISTLHVMHISSYTWRFSLPLEVLALLRRIIIYESTSPR